MLRMWYFFVSKWKLSSPPVIRWNSVRRGIFMVLGFLKFSPIQFFKSLRYPGGRRQKKLMHASSTSLKNQKFHMKATTKLMYAVYEQKLLLIN